MRKKYRKKEKRKEKSKDETKIQQQGRPFSPFSSIFRFIFHCNFLLLVYCCCCATLFIPFGVHIIALSIHCPFIYETRASLECTQRLDFRCQLTAFVLCVCVSGCGSADDTPRHKLLPQQIQRTYIQIVCFSLSLSLSLAFHLYHYYYVCVCACERFFHMNISSHHWFLFTIDDF